ncbi:DUF2939 domain-containing protein [Desulfobaculum bizertense]|uniref:DUF2939 domain-containing protein n=1 Tax=Desulfobaculum bizertense DSM 18034 TaxID=1121442 RepID=A0A1T4VX61_9BACT|nr:DUF2939 domain-containing protein [Desulfobaculum bizertense]SKA69071.1 Protein of unknown function [Desulfobaculum bizertense DSM 18034]
MNKKFLIVGLVCLLGASVGFWYWVNSPTYSLLQARKAMTQHDLKSFRKYVDIEGLLDKGVDDILEQSVEEAKAKNTDNNPLERIGNEFGATLIMMMKPRLVQGWTQALEQAIEKQGDPSGKGKKGSAANDFLKLGEKITSFPSVERQGDVSYATLVVPPTDKTSSFDLRLLLRKKEGYWQVAEVDNLKEILSIIERDNELQRQKLNKEISARNEKVREKIAHYVTTKEAWAKKIPDSETGKLTQIQFTTHVILKNHEAKSVHLSIVVDCGEGQRVGPFLFGGEVSKTKTDLMGRWTHELNPFSLRDNAIFVSKKKKFDTQVEVRKVVLRDGTVLECEPLR